MWSLHSDARGSADNLPFLCATARRGGFSSAISSHLPKPLCLVDRMSVPSMGTLKLSVPGELRREAGAQGRWLGGSQGCFGEEVAREQWDWGRGSCDRKERWHREQQGFQKEGSSVSKDLEPKCVFWKTASYPVGLGVSGRTRQRSRADKTVRRKTFPHLLSRCCGACQSAGREFSKTYFYNSEM